MVVFVSPGSRVDGGGYIIRDGRVVPLPAWDLETYSNLVVAARTLGHVRSVETESLRQELQAVGERALAAAAKQLGAARA
jgi:hypothetical protein